MFRPVVAIIRFYHSTHLRLFYTFRVAACLMRRAQHQNSCCCSNKGFDVELSSSNTAPRELYKIILSESNDKT